MLIDGVVIPSLSPIYLHKSRVFPFSPLLSFPENGISLMIRY